MEQLPSEILGEIFLYLHPKDKVDCMLVCQYWKQVIEQFALYHALDLRSATSLKKITGIVEKNPDLGKRVEHLTISFYEENSDFDLNGFLLLLPNIKTLLCTGPEWKTLITAENTIYPWSKHIRYINEYSYQSITSSLLQSNICPTLTTIDFIDLHVNIIPLLKNAPALKNLTLSTGVLTFADLDTLHESVPCLESFTARGLTFSNSEISQTLNPAISVTECHFDEVTVTPRSLETKRNLLLYVSQKYPNLSKFSYTFFPEDFNNDNIEKLSDSDWLSLLQNVGHKLKYLLVSNSGWFDNTFDVLDRCNCQVEYLNLYALSYAAFIKIVQSQQIHYIRTLVLRDMDFGDFSWLGEFQALKKLKLTYSPYVKYRNDVALDSVIEHSPSTLKTLSIYKIRLTADPKYIGLSNIESLSFHLTKLPKGIDTFITKHFPKLTNLKLKKCDVAEDVFNLESTDLLNFTYHAQYLKTNNVNVSIVTTFDDKKQRCYSLEDGGSHDLGIDDSYCPFYPSVKSWPQSETDIEPDFTLLCNSLNNCILL